MSKGLRFKLPVDEERPRQAVIVAGGRGTRLRPLTDDRPKPMIEFHGRPFLDYLIELASINGFNRLLLLLGYRAQMIREHLGDGSQWGLEIEYAITDPDAQTSTRLHAAGDRLDPRFLFLYCDNYWPMVWEKLWQRFRQAGKSALVTVYRNSDGYSRDNVKLAADGRVELYDRTRTAPGLAGVEIGYAILGRDVLNLIGDLDRPVEELIYPALTRDGELAAYVTDHRYYSVGTLARLPVTTEFLARRPTLILDRDGVLNERPARAEYVRSPEELRWIPGAREALGLLARSGHRVIVVSNQAGIARGAMTEADLAAVHDRLRAEAAEAGGQIEAIYYCPHGWDDGCECRKPQPGMLFQAQHDHHLDLTRTVFIGDDERDRMAADAAGCPFVMVSDSAALLAVAQELVGRRAA